MRRDDGNLFWGTAAGVLAGALWGLVFIAPRLTPDFTAVQISLARYLAYGLLALPLLAPGWRARLSGKLGRADWMALVWLGLTGNVIYYVCLAVAVNLAGPAPTSLIIGLLPVVITLIGTREAGAVPLKRLLMPLLLVTAGVALISANSLILAPKDWWRQALGLLSATGALACWTIYAVLNARCIARLHHVSSQDWSLLLGIVTAAECLVFAMPAFLLSPVPAGRDAWLVFLGVSFGIALLASVVGNSLWNFASRRLPLTMTGQLVVFETLFALLYSFGWEGRWPTLLELLAIAALLGGVWWCVSRHRVDHPAHD
ncbi:MAG: DMT family transporter [Alphaproteobacteria bacterium]|nr:DMT family transporter [Alphaproteobacteria bacterium]